MQDLGKMMVRSREGPSLGSTRDLAEGAGVPGALTHNGNFARPPHLTDPEWPGLLVMIASALLTIVLSVALSNCDLRCRPGDVTTTNGRELCAGARP